MKEDKLGDLSMELSVEVLPKANMPIAAQILLQSLKSHSKKQTRQASGLKCFGEANI